MHPARLASGVRAAIALLVALSLLPGCVSRKLFLKSDPPGARVLLDGRPAGETPYEEDIPAWGTRRLELTLPGYERVDTDLELSTPWWDFFPLDMLSALAPWTIHADREFTYTLAPATPPDLGWDAAERAAQRVKAGPQEPQP